ncbi:MAG TPA: tRNA uridine-5-carboxymethylaminomethyl(34) synthesis GTPase MnmE [Alphaproteobacteria bacterium]|nr:tRNA uridine-5-carboxymethylaminomethyl(34) synthesis GTPase MnmE [Alphaproteobacteria bacterium]
MSGRSIYALSTAPGAAAIAIVRISGPQALDALVALTGRSAFVPRIATLSLLRDSQGQILDQALVLWMPGPRSATGEDLAELHLHGSRVVVHRVLQALSAVPGLALAEPGEFTRQAFYNGRLDLAQAEGLADLIASETEAQADQAVSVLQGGLSRHYNDWRTRLVASLAMAEAVIDFSDDDVPDSAALAILPELDALVSEMTFALNDQHRGEIVREGVQVAIVGAPNAGKSSLLNAMAQRDVAIVSPTPGTTRDIVEVRLNLAGFAVILCDSAGLRQTPDVLEQEGVKRALARAEMAHVRIGLFAVGEPLSEETLRVMRPGDLAVWNKIDLGAPSGEIGTHLTLQVSVQRGDGLGALVGALSKRVASFVGQGPICASPVITRERHRLALSEALASIDRARGLLGRHLDMATEELRAAAYSLGRIAGRVDVEDVLDVVFKTFCIGK